jgi:hypothetical protein
MPELGVNDLVLGYGGDQLADACRVNHPDFAGLVGLPFLRLFEYGGNDHSFWLRRISSSLDTRIVSA